MTPECAAPGAVWVAFAVGAFFAFWLGVSVVGLIAIRMKAVAYAEGYNRAMAEANAEADRLVAAVNERIGAKPTRGAA